MEQIMSTGGGWQDQVGGLSPGIKFITSMPGIDQKIKVEKVQLSEKMKKELQERFVLVYTGQRRLARNLLRDVVGGYLGGRPESIDALEKMQNLAVLMKFALERENLDAFMDLLNQHWELSKRLDGGCTNTCIDMIFSSVEDLIDGKMDLRCRRRRLFTGHPEKRRDRGTGAEASERGIPGQRRGGMALQPGVMTACAAKIRRGRRAAAE